MVLVITLDTVWIYIVNILGVSTITITIKFPRVTESIFNGEVYF